MAAEAFGVPSLWRGCRSLRPKKGEWRAGVQIRSLGQWLLLTTNELPAAGTWVELLVLLERQKEGENSGDSSMHQLPPLPVACNLRSLRRWSLSRVSLLGFFRGQEVHDPDLS